ncbi:hypothetical protein F5Y17DRAFT_453779, partial [Xylariaceae sp. FL0594]
MHGKGFDSALKWFATPVVAQLFSYMADKVSDTATYIQARLSSSSTFANPSVVYYSVCVPNLTSGETMMTGSIVPLSPKSFLSSRLYARHRCPQDWH